MAYVRSPVLMGQEEEPARRGMSTQRIMVSAAIIGALFLGAGLLSKLARGEPMRSNRRRRRRTTRRPTRRRRTTRNAGRRTTRRRTTRRNRITSAQRKRIPLGEFAIPDRRAFPLDTKKRARAALAYLKMGRIGSQADFDRVKAAVRKRWPDVYRAYGGAQIRWKKARAAKRRGIKARRAAN